MWLLIWFWFTSWLVVVVCLDCLVDCLGLFGGFSCLDLFVLSLVIPVGVAVVWVR